MEKPALSLQGPALRRQNRVQAPGRALGPRCSALPLSSLCRRETHLLTGSGGADSQQRDADEAQRAANAPREGGKGPSGTRTVTQGRTGK